MSAILKYEVTNQNKYKTIAAVLKGEFGVSSGLLKELKNTERIYINNKVCRSCDLVFPGDVVNVISYF